MSSQRQPAKDSEVAYTELVNRLLESPHYGERWGRWWLDQARYADSNGYSIDAPRSIWKFRDWVINALNADMPFDQFTIEQLAGDLLPDSTENQKTATGFHRNTTINQEGGIDVEQFRIDSVFRTIVWPPPATFGSVSPSVALSVTTTNSIRSSIRNTIASSPFSITKTNQH